MTWTTDEWDAFCGLIDEAWPGEFDDHAAGRWRILLDGTAPGSAIEALKRLLHEGHEFRPSVSQVLAAARRDPAKPTFAEAYRLIFGPRGVLRARPAARVFADAGAKGRAEQQAALERAAGMHPLVAAFVERQGVDRLRGLELDDPDYGPVRRRDLEQAWNEHVEAFDGREVAALAAGAPRGQAGLHTFDPLAVLAPGRPAPVLGPATTEEVNPA